MVRYVLLSLTLGGFACASDDASGTVVLRDDAQGVSVAGEGEAEAVPDRAEFRVGVEARRPTIAEARQAGAEIQTRILAALRGAGVDDADLRTTQLSLQPEYDYGEEGRRLLGYTARNQVEVTVVDLEKLSEAIDASVTAGGDDVRMEGISFELSDRDAVRERAREKAMREARAKAEQLARLADVELGAAVAISETTFDDEGSPPQPMMMARQMADEASATPVAPGETKVRVRVEVRYAIR